MGSKTEAAEWKKVPGTLFRLRGELLAARDTQGVWRGRLASSALSTATAVSGLILAGHETDAPRIAAGVQQLLASQSDDGWGDTDRSLPNIATTLLAVAALRLAADANVDFSGQLLAAAIARGEAAVDRMGRWEGLRARFGDDETFAAPIMTNCALAGMLPWRAVPRLPFEAAAVPGRFYRFIGLPVVSYAIPALVAIGQVREHFAPSGLPRRLLAGVCRQRTLGVLQRMQPASGGYLEAIPLTSFVLMSLAAMGRQNEEVALAAAKFLRDSIRDDGSWPIDTDLAGWGTALVVHAACGRQSSVAAEASESREALPPLVTTASIEYLLSNQGQTQHPFTGAAPGGWGWTDLSGAVPDADDTPAAILALCEYFQHAHATDRRPDEDLHRRAALAVAAGLKWLVDLQNRDGGWPTFCRGWGKLPFDRSGCDLTAHVLRAFSVAQDCAEILPWCGQEIGGRRILRQLQRSAAGGWRYLSRQQRPDGLWLPLWFGNQDRPEEDNPVYGTARVLLAYAQCGRHDDPAAARGLGGLLDMQNADGGWGGGPSVRYISSDGQTINGGSSIEETAVAVEALAWWPEHRVACDRGRRWLENAIERGWHHQPQPIGLYFAKLWYHEQLYPLVFSLAALR